jgi:hypothetical protein
VSAVANKTPPTLSEFLVCDDIRQEVGNKVSLIGVYAGGSVVLSAGTTAPQLIPSLCFFARFTNGDGQYTVLTSLIDPSGNAVHKAPIQNVTLTPAAAYVVIIQVYGLQYSRGRYTVKVEFDSQTYSRTFDVT